MAGGKIKFINDILYIYNSENPKVNIKEQVRADGLIRGRKIYNTIV